MSLAERIRDYYRKRTEEKVYNMLVNGIELISTSDISSGNFEKGDTLIKRAQELIKSRGIQSRRVQQEIANALYAYSET